MVQNFRHYSLCASLSMDLEIFREKIPDHDRTLKSF